LKLDQATKHLKTEAAHHQLEKHLSQLLDKPITVELELVELSKDDPFQIQSHIDDKRYDYAKQLIEKDEWVIAMQNQFQAIIDEKTIQAR
jgi:DNA polymerase-3 subunit gamma/tau